MCLKVKKINSSRLNASVLFVIHIFKKFISQNSESLKFQFLIYFYAFLSISKMLFDQLLNEGGACFNQFL